MSDAHGSHGPKKNTYVDPSAGNHAPHEEGEAWLISYADLMTLLVGFFVILLSFSSVDEEKLEGLKRAITQEFGGSYQVPFGDMADRLRDKLKNMGLGDQFLVKSNDRGVEISFYGTLFFNTGSADMKDEGAELMDRLIPVVRAEAADFTVIVEGHTDDVPISNGKHFRNNWELSSLRACRVLEAFEEGGFDKANLTALGYGDARPVVPNRDAEGNAIPQNQSQNRRVVIKLIKQAVATLGPSTPEAKINSPVGTPPPIEASPATPPEPPAPSKHE
ncbi:flagellar motor protein MotB [soil metagenome]